MQFSLDTNAAGQLSQKSQLCGSFRSIEDAFDNARRLAAEKWVNLPKGGSAGVSLVDTEWGYDLRRGHLTVHRFWVHDNKPAELT